MTDPRPSLICLPPPRLRRDRLDRLERHLRGLQVHLQAIGLRAEASAVMTELDLIRDLR